MGKGLHKVLKTVMNDISQVLPTLGESGSEVLYFIPEPINFWLSDYIFRRHQENFAKCNFEGDQKYNQQSEFSSSRSR